MWQLQHAKHLRAIPGKNPSLTLTGGSGFVISIPSGIALHCFHNSRNVWAELDCLQILKYLQHNQKRLERLASYEVFRSLVRGFISGWDIFTSLNISWAIYLCRWIRRSATGSSLCQKCEYSKYNFSNIYRIYTHTGDNIMHRMAGVSSLAYRTPYKYILSGPNRGLVPSMLNNSGFLLFSV